MATGTHTSIIAGQDFSVWKNDTYTVLVRRVTPHEEGWPPLIHLSIRRNDREPARDWRDFQRIKNDIVGPEHEGVELFPAESRLVDTSNQYHIWVVATPGIGFPFGFTDRLVGEGSYNGSVQRPFGPDVPADAIAGSSLT